MTKIDERKNIIITLKSMCGERKKGIDKRIQFIKGLSILNLIIAIICSGIIIATIILEPLGLGYFKWEMMGLLTILNINFVLPLPKFFFEFKLLNHHNKISDKKDFIGIEKLNAELKTIVNQLNKDVIYNMFYLPLILVILISGIVQVTFEDSNPYWNYIKIPVLLFFGMTITKFYLTNTKLTKNINQTERQCCW